MENKIELLEHKEFLRESAGKFLRYQTEKKGEDSFSADFFFEIGYEPESAKSSVWNCDVSLMRREEGGAQLCELSGKLTAASEGKAILSLPALPRVPFELLIRPYTVDDLGMYRFGVTYIFYYQGGVDGEGRPSFSTLSREACRVAASEDTYIFNETGFEETDHSKQLLLQIRNTGDENSSLYRASYFKFTLDAESVKALDTVASAKVRFYVFKAEDNSSRKIYPLTVHGVDANWNASELNYSNFRTLAADRALLAEGIRCESGCFKVDILDYLRAQKRNADGSLTVAFRVTNEGHEDARVIYLNSSKNEFSKPSIELGYYNSIDYNLNTALNVGFEPWGYAKMLVDEWFDDLRDKIYPRDAEGNLIYHDELGKLDPYGYAKEEPMGDFTHPIDWRYGSRWLEKGGIVADDAWKKDKYVRTLDRLGVSEGKPYSESPYAKADYGRDTYGGIVGTEIKGKATGFFHIEKHGKRTYIIDPLGNPYFAIGVNTTCLGDNQNLKDYSLERFGDRETYFKEITASLKEMGITINHLGENLELLKQEDGLVNVVGLSVVGAYMRTMGRSQISEGVYPHNNTINLFDPDFVKCSHEVVGARIREGGFAEMDRLFGYTTDNEQPSGIDILERYLTLDTKEPTNAFSYATAWTWLARRMNCLLPTLEAYQSLPDYREINSEFLGFMYGRYGKVAREAVEAVDKNHMLIGSRVNGNCPKDEGYLRAAGYYLDLITTNLYGGLNPDAETITNLYRYAGKPFIVTEFYAKAVDAIDANGYPLANSTGAGQLVKTQQDRGDYYEHYAMALLESAACVGWTWYRYRDNDQGLYRQVGKDNEMYMCHITYGRNRHVNTFMDGGVIRTAAEVGEFEEIYKGEPMASNQNANKGIFTCRFESLVSIYHYDKDGKLLSSEGYAVETPETETPDEGTVLKALRSDASYTIGTSVHADGGRTETVLTVYDGRYIPLSRAISKISRNVMGLVHYFDAKYNR